MIANRLAQRSGPTNVGFFLGSRLFASRFSLSEKDIAKINFFKLMQTGFSWRPFCIPDCNEIRRAWTC